MARKKNEPRSTPDPAEAPGSGEERTPGPGLLDQFKAAGARFARAAQGDEAPDGTPEVDDRRKEAVTRSEQRALLEAMRERDRQSKLFAELGTFVWYLKTRHFKKEWADPAPDSDDPNERRTLTRLRRVLEALEAGGVTVDDPTGWRYPDGGEGWMKPIQITPTPGVESAVVTDTLKPIVYRDEQLIQRGEVFVASPVIDDDNPQDPAGDTDLASADEEEQDDDPND